MKCTKLTNAVNRAIEQLGDSWTLAILGSLRTGEQRFCELQRLLDDLNPATLTQRLKMLEREQMIYRKEETVNKISVVYGLTPKGRAFVPVIEKLEGFAERFLS